MSIFKKMLNNHLLVLIFATFFLGRFAIAVIESFNYPSKNYENIQHAAAVNHPWRPPAKDIEIPYSAKKIILPKGAVLLSTPVSLIKKISSDDFAKLIKAKYPEYNSLPNDKLVSMVLNKYPLYRLLLNEPSDPFLIYIGYEIDTASNGLPIFKNKIKQQ